MASRSCPLPALEVETRVGMEVNRCPMTSAMFFPVWMDTDMGYPPCSSALVRVVANDLSYLGR